MHGRVRAAGTRRGRWPAPVLLAGLHRLPPTDTGRRPARRRPGAQRMPRQETAATMTNSVKSKVWRIITGQTRLVQIDAAALGGVYLAADGDTIRALESAVDPEVLEACAYLALHGPTAQRGSGNRLR
ncbi:hypothetical protein J1763_gp79 [Gordonia phage YorkOnyx]|uniref:Uncharacterized protein n=1 Tax=Gordonia phage YorkOnyx TaxID=2762402 RepID=A0A7G8LMC8_9CAUD|nr:hypothetical protein J1763_gp79 [Gordonia phage YorkOnyx]QNJ58400.1 hypothetical protein SEA_YORKONYX_79 [Gordonia phage YorkOnyx]